MSTPLLFGWLDLVAPDPELAEDFYRDLLGWETERLDLETIADYRLFTCNGDPVGGLIAGDRDDENLTAAWLPSLACASVDAAAMQVENLGGELAGEVTELPGIGHTIIFRDPQQAALALLEEDAGGDPLDPNAPTGFFIGCDLLTSQLDDAIAFYTKLCNWQQTDGHILHRRSIAFAANNQIVAGAWEAPAQSARAWWVPAVAVDNVAETVAKSARLGAQTIIPPVARANVEAWAVIVDAVGAPLGLIQR